jgi:membrane-bound metal-dependent hydrolase YbcI (DUF457 family)
MDPGTHICSGVLLGQALRPAAGVRRGTVAILGLAAFAPDLDAVSYLWGSLAYSHVHHAYTHTLLGALTLVGILSVGERFLLPALSFPRLAALNVAGLTLHLLGDLVAIWPLRLLAPWNDRDVVLRWTGDFDLAVWVIVWLATGLSTVDQFRARAPWIAATALLLIVAYFWWIPGAAGLR